MSRPTPPGAAEERRKLFELMDRLAAVDRQAAPKRRLPDDFIAGQWLHGGAATRRRIEQEIERLPKKAN